MTAYYNEIEPYAAAWLRNLIAAGHVPAGDVDERDIRDVQPGDLAGYDQCHFFAGIGGWAFACRLAGWPDDRPIWTGSCPCQPFSAAGSRAGFADERHLWPSWFHLIEQCEPGVVFGEQVASADGLVWLDLVSADMEGAGYAIAATDLCAAGLGAPHIRQRLFWVADASRRRQREQRSALEPGQGRIRHADIGHNAGGFWSYADWIPFRDGKHRPVEPGTFPLADGISARTGRLRALGNAIVPQVAAEVIGAWLEVSCTHTTPAGMEIDDVADA